MKWRHEHRRLATPPGTLEQGTGTEKGNRNCPMSQQSYPTMGRGPGAVLLSEGVTDATRTILSSESIQRVRRRPLQPPPTHFSRPQPTHEEGPGLGCSASDILRLCSTEGSQTSRLGELSMGCSLGSDSSRPESVLSESSCERQSLDQSDSHKLHSPDLSSRRFSKPAKNTSLSVTCHSPLATRGTRPFFGVLQSLSSFFFGKKPFAAHFQAMRRDPRF